MPCQLVPEWKQICKKCQMKNCDPFFLFFMSIISSIQQQIKDNCELTHLLCQFWLISQNEIKISHMNDAMHP